MNSPAVALLIPAYRPSQELLKLIESISARGHENFSRIVVVDDGSGDEFAAIFSAVARFGQVTVLRHAVNSGKGAALKTGFNHIFTTGDEISVVTADADGQHAADDIAKVAQASALHAGTLVMGARTFGTDIPFRSWIGNQLTRQVLRLVTGLKLTDTQTGLRAWPKQLALGTLEIPINGYDFEMEALVQTRRIIGGDAASIIEVPIATIYLEGNSSSHFDPLLDSMRIYFVFLRFCGAGLFAALVDNLVFVTAYAVNGDVLTSQVMSRASGAAVSFLMSYRLVFNSRGNPIPALIKFSASVVLFGYVSYGMINFMVSSTAMNVVVAKLLAELILFCASFAIQRDFIFKKPH